MKQYSFLMESINNSNIDLIKKNFKWCINAYKQVYNFDLSYMKLKIDQQPVYNNGKPCHELKQEESGGSWTKLKYIQIGTRGRTNKTTRKLLRNWNLGLLHSAIEQKCEENCVHLHYVNPKYTSRTCPACGNIDKRNREGTVFKCVNCGYEDNADINAAKNILSRFHQENSKVSDIVPDSAKAENKIIYFW